MISGVGAYQQISVIQQATQQTARQSEATEVREGDRDRDDATTVKQAQTAALNESNEAKTSDDDRRQLAANDQQPQTQTAGKDAAQRRGSLLDVVA